MDSQINDNPTHEDDSIVEFAQTDSAQSNRESETASQATANETKAISIEEQLIIAKLEISELNDRLLRKQAEFENYRKRSAQERLDFLRTSKEEFALAVLPVLDSFQRAMDTQNQNHSVEDIHKGFELILQQFQKALEKEGVIAMSCVSEMFDPERHMAVSHKEEKGKKEGEIITEFQKGYLLNTKIIRPAMVVVAKE